MSSALQGPRNLLASGNLSRRPRLAPYLFLLVLLCWFSSQSHGVEVYLTPYGNPAWTGKCDSTCPQSSPCGVSSGSTLANENTNPCEIYFASGNYGWTNTWSAAFAAKMSFEGTVSGVNLAVNLGSPMVLDAYGASASLESGVLLTISTTSLTVGNLTFSNGASLIATVTSTATVQRCSFFSSASSTASPLTISGSSLTITDTLIWAIHSVAAIAHPSVSSWSSMTLTNCQITVGNAGMFNAALIYNLLIQSTLIASTANDESFVLLNIPTISTITTYDTTFQGALPGRSGIPIPGNAFPRPILTKAACYSFDFGRGTVFQGVQIITPSSPPGSGSLYFTNTTLIDSDVLSYATNQWNHVSINQMTSNASVTLANGSGGAMNNVTFSAGADPQNARFRVIGATTATIVGSSFTVSDFVIGSGAAVHISEVEITNSLTCPDSSAPGTLYVQAPAKWTFRSIDVTNVNVMLYNIIKFTYKPTVPNKGITQTNSTFSGNPPLISIAWSPKLPDPQYMQKYPIFKLTTPVVAAGETVPIEVVQPDFLWNVSYASPPELSFYSRYLGSAMTCNPPPGFLCAVGGGLYSPASVTEPSIIVPPNSGVIPVAGNITVNTTITFIGTGSSLVADGCVQVPGGISIELSKGNTVPKGSVTLITQSSACDALLAPVSLKYDKKDCRKTTVKKDPNAASNTLAVIFKVDNSDCNVKWIILGSVLGGVLIITLALALIFTFNKSARNCIRPFAGRSGAKQNPL